jgi:hypothetical protein
VRIQASIDDQPSIRASTSEKGIEGLQSQTLPPGTRQTFTVAFGTPAGHGDFRMQVEPVMSDYEPVWPEQYVSGSKFWSVNSCAHC